MLEDNVLAFFTSQLKGAEYAHMEKISCVVQDGTPCRNAVNISTCPYCDYHVQSQYNKIRSKRSELKDNRLHNAFHYTNGARLGQLTLCHLTC